MMRRLKVSKWLRRPDVPDGSWQRAVPVEEDGEARVEMGSTGHQDRCFNWYFKPMV